MIPLSDDNPTRGKPYILYILVIANVLVFLVDRVGAVGPFGRLWTLSMIPYSVIHDMRVVPLLSQVGQIVGARPDPGIGPHPQWITIFTSMFMHGGWLHLGGNMLYLWIFGNNIEDALGHVKFLLFYLACGAGAALLHIASDPGSTIPTVGASGAIAGVLGAYLLLYPKARIRTLIILGYFIDYAEIPAIYVLGVWFLVQFVSGAMQPISSGGGVAYWAHVGGFVAGIVFILLLGGRRLVRQQRRGMEPYDERYR